MSARTRDARSTLYTVRVWPEPVEGGKVEWRGKVQSVSNGETLFFRDWNTMMEFIRDSCYQQSGEFAAQSDRGKEVES